MRSAPIIGLLAILVGAALPALAHEVRPGYLQLREIAPNAYAVLWKLPLSAAAGQRLAPVLPPNCRPTSEVVSWRGPVSIIERWTVACDGGLQGRPLSIDGLEATLTEVLVRVEDADGAARTAMLRPQASSMVVAAEPSTLAVARTYTRLGTTHILLGIDHLLFVLALLLLVKKRWVLVKTITAFTVAHSVTLGLATLGFVRIPSSPVEAVIALSIMFLAAELLRSARGDATLTVRYPWIAAFGFGLLHGLGFAGALTALGLPAGDIPVALLFFNVGVELGQLLFVAAVLVLVGVARRLQIAWPEWAVPLPPYAIGTVASYWFIGRFLAVF